MKANAETGCHRYKGFAGVPAWINGFAEYFIGFGLADYQSDAMFLVTGFAVISGIMPYNPGFFPKLMHGMMKLYIRLMKSGHRDPAVIMSTLMRSTSFLMNTGSRKQLIPCFVQAFMQSSVQ
jgi:hypothetical protein